MLHRQPLHPLKQRAQGDGQIGQHEQGEGKGIQHLLPPLGVDLLPLGRRGHGPQEEQQAVGVGKPPQQAGQDAFPVPDPRGQQQQVRRPAGQGQQDRRHIGHAHIIAGKAALFLEDPPEELSAVAVEHLQISFGPAQALPPGLAKSHRLLVEELCLGTVPHPPAGGDVVDGELDVLREQEEVPPAAGFQDLTAEQEARPGHGGAGAQEHPGVVQILRFPEEPQSIAGGDPVVGVVFGVAVAGDHLVASGKGPVHLTDVVPAQEVVRVEDEEAVELIQAVVPPDCLQEEMQDVALADLLPVLPLVDRGAGGPGDLGGGVGAVVRGHEDLDQIAGVILGPDALYQLGDHRLLVACGDEHGVAVVLPPVRGPVFFQEGHRQVDELVGITGQKQD